ncbi:MAG: hypothetical protein HY979_02370 [Candidatus Magasanikbacteria bacterium]|nr:hypothetical protein [Candidatus Magasanikbacteria bacterium]
MNLSVLEKSILRTLVYFDLGAYPLTANEIWQFLHKEVVNDFKILLSTLENLKDKNIISEQYGFYFLFGRQDLVEKRRSQLVISELKLKKAQRAAKFIMGVPFLKAIFVCNTVAAGTAFKESDIDFFIITEKNRLYIVRFFVNLILRIFGLRTYGSQTADRICLSFFVDDQNLNLEKLKALSNDIHFAYWILQMTPIYDPQNYFKRFLSANHWIKKYTPNFNFQTQYVNVVKPNIIMNSWQKIWQTIWQGQYGNLIETQAREWQLLKMQLSLKEKAKMGDNGVVINKGVVKLHEHDTRRAIYESWNRRVNEFGL